MAWKCTEGDSTHHPTSPFRNQDTQVKENYSARDTRVGGNQIAAMLGQEFTGDVRGWFS